TAVYVDGFPRPRERSLVFMDRSGRPTPIRGAKRPFQSPALSPDGRRVAVSVEGDEDALWVLDVQSGTFNRLTFGSDTDAAEWSADGRSVTFTSNADGPFGVYRVAADGAGKPERLFSHPVWWINDVSQRPDGSGILVAAQDVRGHDFYFVRTGSQQAQPFLVTPSEERRPAFSPDGAFIVYDSNESDRFEVYVRRFSEPGLKR